MSNLLRTILGVVAVLLIVASFIGCMISFTPIRTQQNTATSAPTME